MILFSILSSQPLVGVSFKETSKTFKSNIMGTVNVMEAIKIKIKQVIIVVTSDKVYQNDELGISFKENSSLGGKDPYSGSKSSTRYYSSSIQAFF